MGRRLSEWVVSWSRGGKRFEVECGLPVEPKHEDAVVLITNASPAGTYLIPDVSPSATRHERASAFFDLNGITQVAIERQDEFEDGEDTGFRD
jgi:hypothetical protein